MTAVAGAGAAIAAASGSLDRALIDGDPVQVAGHFTIDAVLGESGLDDVVGREAIRGFLEQGNRVRTVTHHEIHRTELLVFDRLAVEYGWFSETKIKPGQSPIHERGRTVTYWRHDDDGVWRIRRIVVSDLPLPDSPP